MGIIKIQLCNQISCLVWEAVNHKQGSNFANLTFERLMKDGGKVKEFTRYAE
jgi:hypothetical protein